MRNHSQRTGRLILVLLVTTAAGIPLVAVIWHALNELLSGRFQGRSLAAGSAALVALFVLLRVLASQLERLGGNGL